MKASPQCISHLCEVWTPGVLPTLLFSVTSHRYFVYLHQLFKWFLARRLFQDKLLLCGWKLKSIALCFVVCFLFHLLDHQFGFQK